MKRLAVLAFAMSLSSTASAMNGAEFMSKKNAYNIGYVYGVVETRLIVVLKDDPSQPRIRECITGADVTPNTIYDLTVEYLKRNPSYVPMPVVAAILNTIAEMCPPRNLELPHKNRTGSDFCLTF
jgi:hypothetical protein